MQTRIDQATNGTGQFDFEKLSLFVKDISKDYTEKFTYNLLHDLLVDDISDAKDEPSK